ncbi:unnamed protein product [Closterium sp. Naga37s-1]|nr:unnamed protein product [Closterium sp. Naga37s-1]
MMLAVAAVVVVLSSIPFAAAGSLLGGWSAVKGAAKSKEVKEVASFAVDAYNKQQGKSLKLVSVVSAKSQVVAGTNWIITLKAAAVTPVARHLGRRRASPPVTTYVAEVFQSLWPVGEDPTVAAQPADAAQPVGNGQPAVGNGQPVVSNGKPAVGNGQPVVSNGQPVVSNEQPVVDGQSGAAQSVMSRRHKTVLADYLKLVSFSKEN